MIKREDLADWNRLARFLIWACSERFRLLLLSIPEALIEWRVSSPTKACLDEGLRARRRSGNPPLPINELRPQGDDTDRGKALHRLCRPLPCQARSHEPQTAPCGCLFRSLPKPLG